MILVDTSVWIDHLRVGVPVLAQALDTGRVWMHPFVLGELACGNVKNRREVLQLFDRLPKAPVATDDEALGFIERHKFWGLGIGYLDVHLLASAVLAPATRLWTRDRRLGAMAEAFGVAFDPST